MDLGSRITDVEKLITYDLTVVADILKNAHQLHIPMLQRNRYAAADRLNVLDQEVQSKIEEIASVVEDVQTDAISDEATSIRSRLEALGEARHFVETVEEIERHIASCYVTDVAILTRAQIVKELQSLMKECVEAGTAISVGESILSSLGNAVREQREYLGWVLSDFFRSAIDFSQHPRGYYTMNINFASAYDATNYFTAMQDVGELDPRLTRWATFVVDKLCAAVISGGGRSDSVRSRVDRTEATRTVFEVRIPQKNEKASIDCSAVFTLLSTLFKSISQALAGVSVHQSPLSLILGRKIEKPLMTLVLKEVMTVCVPAATSLDDPLFKEVVETAEKFRADLIEQQIFNDASASFGSFSESTERVFIDRRCLSILNQARDLIIAPYLTLTSVGHDGEVAEETLGDFENVFGKSLSTNIRSMDDTYPRLFAMQRCQVSESTMKLVELIEQTLRDAAHVDSEMAAERLALTARNIVQLFVLTAPKQHHTAISSVPEQAAVFFNNCYFILHRIMMMGFNLCKDQTKQIVESFRPVFSDNVVRLRLIAAEALEGLLAQCRRNISAELVDRNFFSSAYLNGDMEREVRVPKVLRRCTDQISSVAVVFRRVLTETVYGKSLGNLCSFLLTELGELVLGMEDITQADANFTALDLEKVLEDHLMPHFEIGGFNIMHKMCENAFFRTKEIIFCLKGSLQGIDDRWCAGKGPLAQWLTAAEVRHLVKALFANSELRKRLLEKIF